MTLSTSTTSPASSDSRLTMAGGVRAGANRPPQLSASMAPKPASAMVGTSGSAASRFVLVTASGTILPLLMCGAEVTTKSNIASMLPEVKSTSAALLDLYGMWVKWAPVHRCRRHACFLFFR